MHLSVSEQYMYKYIYFNPFLTTFQTTSNSIMLWYPHYIYSNFAHTSTTSFTISIVFKDWNVNIFYISTVFYAQLIDVSCRRVIWRRSKNAGSLSALYAQIYILMLVHLLILPHKMSINERIWLLLIFPPVHFACNFSPGVQYQGLTSYSNIRFW